jgi:hypothetical protein
VIPGDPQKEAACGHERRCPDRARLVSAAERAVGHSGHTLTELRLACTCPCRKGEGETQAVLPVTIWAGDVGAAVREMPEGTPLTVVRRLSAREYHIVIPGDLQDVARRPTGTFSGTLRGEAVDSRP